VTHLQPITVKYQTNKFCSVNSALGNCKCMNLMTHWFAVAKRNVFIQLSSHHKSTSLTHSLWHCWRRLTARYKHFSWLVRDNNHCWSFAFAALSQQCNIISKTMPLPEVLLGTVCDRRYRSAVCLSICHTRVPC